MPLEELQQQTTKNIQEKANLIWDIATHLAGPYKPSEYGKVILPMTVLKRFDDALKDTKENVLREADRLDKEKDQDEDGELTPDMRDLSLRKASGLPFYNTSKFDFSKLNASSDNIKANFEDYLSGYSDNVKEIMEYFKFSDQIDFLAESKLLYLIINEFCGEKGDMSNISSADMGYIFEELIRKFSESANDKAGLHFTSRDIIYLMTELLVAPNKESMVENPVDVMVYDMAMGTSQMLGCLTEKMKEINPDSTIKCYGQEVNPETYAIAKSDMLIKGGNVNGMKFGDTLSEDQFSEYEFDYIISNPPFGFDWKLEKESVQKEHDGDPENNISPFDGRFWPGLPSIDDSQMLFLLNGVKKLRGDNGRMAIIQDGSSLFTGDAESGPSEIRRYIIESDYLEAVVQLPTDLFYNTNIATYIWIVSKNKTPERRGKIQLIDASQCFVKRRKNIGNKRVDLSSECINLIVKAYDDFTNESLTEGKFIVESKIFDNSHFGYTKIVIETAIIDEKGNAILKKGKFQPVKGETDSEKVPLDEDIETYFKREVLPFNPNAYMDRRKDKIGYEIPFARAFYKYVVPRKSDVVYAEIEKLMNEEDSLMKELVETADEK